MSFAQIWDVVEHGDIGCTRGGGSDARAVFSGAGLLYASSARFKTPSRQGSYEFPQEKELFVVLCDVGLQKHMCLCLLFILITIFFLVSLNTQPWGCSVLNTRVEEVWTPIQTISGLFVRKFSVQLQSMALTHLQTYYYILLRTHCE